MIAYNVITNGAPHKRTLSGTMARFRLVVGPVPLHHQVYLDLSSALDAGEWKPGDRLPPERELAERYGCSLITVRRALFELSREMRIAGVEEDALLPGRISEDMAAGHAPVGAIDHNCANGIRAVIDSDREGPAHRYVRARFVGGGAGRPRRAAPGSVSDPEASP